MSAGSIDARRLPAPPEERSSFHCAVSTHVSNTPRASRPHTPAPTPRSSAQTLPLRSFSSLSVNQNWLDLYTATHRVGAPPSRPFPAAAQSKVTRLRLAPLTSFFHSNESPQARHNRRTTGSREAAATSSFRAQTSSRTPHGSRTRGTSTKSPMIATLYSQSVRRTGTELADAEIEDQPLSCRLGSCRWQVGKNSDIRHGHAVAVRILRQVHGFVSQMQQALFGAGIDGIRCHSHARCQFDVQAILGEPRRFANQAVQPARHVRRVFFGCLRQQQHKLVAAITKRKIDQPAVLLQCIAYIGEQP